MDETPRPAPLRWYQYRLRGLLLLMIAVSLACSWLAVRWQRQRELHIVKVVITRPNYHALLTQDTAMDVCFPAMSLPVEDIVAVSSYGKSEIYIAARGGDREEFLDRIRRISSKKLPFEATVKEIKLLDRGESIPQVKTELADVVRVNIDLSKCAEFGVSREAILAVLSRRQKAKPTREDVRFLQDLLIETQSAAHPQKVRLGDIVEIKLAREPSQSVWRYPTESKEPPESTNFFDIFR